MQGGHGDEAELASGIFRRADAVQGLQSNNRIRSSTDRKFNREWRTIFGEACSGLPIPILLTEFHEHYGIRSQPCDFLWPPPKQTLTEKSDEQVDENVPDLDSLSIENVLSRLPLPDLVRARVVCKAWNATVSSSPTFGALWDSSNWDASKHYLVAQHTSEGSHGMVLFSPSLNRWFRIPLNWRYAPLSVLLCAAAGGFFLFVDWNSGEDYNLVVANPLTEQCRVLPDSPMHQGWDPEMAVEMISDLHTSSFKVIVIANNDSRPSNICALIYDSRTNNWVAKIAETPYPSFCKSPWRSTVHNGVVYCTNTYGLHMVSYDDNKEEFDFLEIEGLPRQIDFSDLEKNPQADLPSIVVCGGRVIFAGRLQREAWIHQWIFPFKDRKREKSIMGRLPLIKHNSVGLWELDFKEQRWSLISVTPRDLLEAVVKTSEGTDFLVASDGRDCIWFMLRGSANLLGFDLRSMAWNLLPGCPGEDIMDPSPRRAFYRDYKSMQCAATAIVDTLQFL